jgi:hypothetical protein
MNPREDMERAKVDRQRELWWENCGRGTPWRKELDLTAGEAERSPTRGMT